MQVPVERAHQWFELFSQARSSECGFTIADAWDLAPPTDEGTADESEDEDDD